MEPRYDPTRDIAPSSYPGGTPQQGAAPVQTPTPTPQVETTLGQLRALIKSAQDEVIRVDGQIEAAKARNDDYTVGTLQAAKLKAQSELATHLTNLQAAEVKERTTAQTEAAKKAQQEVARKYQESRQGKGDGTDYTTVSNDILAKLTLDQIDEPTAKAQLEDAKRRFVDEPKERDLAVERANAAQLATRRVVSEELTAGRTAAQSREPGVRLALGEGDTVYKMAQDQWSRDKASAYAKARSEGKGPEEAIKIARLTPHQDYYKIRDAGIARGLAMLGMSESTGTTPNGVATALAGQIPTTGASDPNRDRWAQPGGPGSSVGPGGSGVPQPTRTPPQTPANRDLYATPGATPPPPPPVPGGMPPEQMLPGPAAAQPPVPPPMPSPIPDPTKMGQMPPDFSKLQPWQGPGVPDLSKMTPQQIAMLRLQDRFQLSSLTA